MTETLYLTIKPRRQSRWRSDIRIAAVSKRRPKLMPGTQIAVVKLNIQLPDDIVIPTIPVATVTVPRELIQTPKVEVKTEPI